MFKFVLSGIFALLIMASVVLATTTTLSESSLTMEYYDTQEVAFSLSGAGGSQQIAIVIEPTCKDINGMYGCQAGDEFNVDHLFTVTPNQTMMNDGDTVLLTLQTTIQNPEDAGVFYYTVNGVIGETVIGSETGFVEVPEFGILAGLVLLAGFGLIIYKRKL